MSQFLFATLANIGGPTALWGRMNLAHGRAAGTPRYRAAYALAFATFSIRPLMILGNHPISVFDFRKHRRTVTYVGAHELGSRPRCWNASLPSRIRACVCYFCYFFDPPFDFPRESPLAHGVALSHRR